MTIQSVDDGVKTAFTSSIIVRLQAMSLSLVSFLNCFTRIVDRCYAAKPLTNPEGWTRRGGGGLGSNQQKRLSP